MATKEEKEMIGEEKKGIKEDINGEVRSGGKNNEDKKLNRQKFITAYNLFGKNNKISFKKAFELFYVLAQKGYIRSAFYVGVCFDNGYGVKKNYRKAYRYYLYAAKRNHSAAQYNVYLMNRDGIGVDKNFPVALYWLKKAVNNHDIEAIRELGYCYHEGRGVKRDYKKACQLYKKAAKKKDKIARYNLALCYKYGEGVKISRRWYEYWLIKSKQSKYRQHENNYSRTS